MLYQDYIKKDTLGEQGYKIATYICGQDYSLAETREILNIKPRHGRKVKRGIVRFGRPLWLWQY